MPLYAYEALTSFGKKKKGVIKADSLVLAKELLKRETLFPTHLEICKKIQREISLSSTMLIAFTRDLSQLLSAGLPLYESLLAIEEKYHGHAAHPLLADLCEKIKQGKKLSEVLSFYPKVFDKIYISMIASSEETGSLEAAVKELEKLISKAQKLKKQLISAMIYPIFLLSFCHVVIAGLLFFLIPSMEQLFEGRELHPMTHAVLMVSCFFRSHGLVLLVALIVTFLVCIGYFRTEKGIFFLKKSLLKMPIIGKMMTEAILVRFSRSLCVMLRGSVPLTQALALSCKTMNHPLFEQIILQSEKRILQGGKLSEELSRNKLIPSLVVRMVSIGEEAGTMAQMFYNIADIYEEELERSLTRLTAMLQPIILLFLAIVVGVVIISILLPLTDVGSFLNT